MAESINNLVESKKKSSNFLKKYFNSKEISSDYNYPFDFKNANWYVTIIYLVSFIILPIIYSLIKNYVFHVNLIDNKLPNPWNNIELIIVIFLPIISMSIAFAVDWKAMIKGGWAAYTHFIFGLISVFFVGLFLIQTKIISGKSNDSFSLAVSFLVQVIIQFIGSLIVIFTDKRLKQQIIATLKEAKKDLLTWIIFFLLIVSLLNFIFEKISSVVNTYNFFTNNTPSVSDNQKQLKLMVETPLGIFALILGSIFLAPINEEISYRYGTFSIVRHKWLGFFASLLYFPAMHIMTNGDWNNIFGYLGMGIAAPLLFIITRGNTTYTIGLHMLINTIATISLLVTLE